MHLLYLLFLTVFISCTGAWAQDTSKLPAPFAIYVMPTQFLNISHASGFTAGTEFRLFKQLSATVEAGNFYTNGFMGKANLKYYLPIKKEGKREFAYYFAMEYAYKEQRYAMTDRLKDPPETNVDYTVSKYVSSAHIKFGRVMSRRRSFYTDGYFGIGVRYRTVHNSLLPGQWKTLYHWNEGFIDNFTNSKADGFAPSVSLGWKIGYRYK